MAFGTWNVRTLRRAGKLENLKKEMIINELDILGISEMRWEGSGELWSDDFKVMYSGGDKAVNGVGMLVRK